MILENALVLFYHASIHSVLEYVAPVWHYDLKVEKKNLIEGIEKKAMKIIRGIPRILHDYNYDQFLASHGMKRLADRREEICRRTIRNLDDDLKEKIPEKVIMRRNFGIPLQLFVLGQNATGNPFYHLQ